MADVTYDTANSAAALPVLVRKTDVGEAGATGLLAAAIRAAESARTDRMFDDPFAEHFVADSGRELLAELDEGDASVERGGVPSGLVTRAYVALRTCFMDDVLRVAVDDLPGVQVVILAAGMDARAYRHRWLEDVPVYELDRDAVLAYKQRIVDELCVTPYAMRQPVAVDLSAEWTAPLAGAGFEPQRPSVWLVEGLLCYLPQPRVAALLTAIASVSAPGSRLAVDIVNADMLTVPETQEMLQRYQNWGHPWLFGTNQPAGLLAGYGYTAVVNRPGAPPYDHPRWPLSLVPAGIPNVPRWYFVDGVRNAARPAG